MKKIQKRIEEITEKLKSNNVENEFPNWYIIHIKSKITDFYKCNASVSDFIKKITNGKIKLNDSVHNNREYWKSISPKGYYRFQISKETIEIILVLNTIEEINQPEFLARIRKVCHYCEINFGDKDKTLLEQMVFKLTRVENGGELLGLYKRQSLNEYYSDRT